MHMALRVPLQEIPSFCPVGTGIPILHTYVHSTLANNHMHIQMFFNTKLAAYMFSVTKRQTKSLRDVVNPELEHNNTNVKM